MYLMLMVSEVGNFYEEALLQPPSGQCVFLTPLIANAGELSSKFDNQYYMIPMNILLGWFCRNDKRPIERVQAMKRESPICHLVTRKKMSESGKTLGKVIDENVIYIFGL